MRTDDQALKDDDNLETQKLLYVYLSNKGRKKIEGERERNEKSLIFACLTGY